MLTNLDFIKVGAVFPPKSEQERLNLYAYNMGLWDGDHAELYKEAFKRVERVLGNFDQVISYSTVINYHKLISLKMADLLLGEEPQISAGEIDSPEQKSVDTIKKNADVQNTFYQAALDLSRCGDGVVTVSKDGDKGNIDVTQPRYWFPVVDPENIKRYLYHVLAWVIKRDDNQPTDMYAHIHEKGWVTKRKFKVEKNIKGGFTLLAEIGTPVREKTGLDDFAVIQLPNVVTSDRIHGMDDYSDIDSIISELLVRLAQISRILDKHAAPSVSGDNSMLERDPISKEYRLKMGNFFGRDGKDAAEPKYITWDGHLESNFKMIEQLINALHAISETGGQLLGDTNQEGGALSGTALRMKMVSPLAKVKRIAMRFKPAMEKAIVLCSQLGGEDVVDLSKTSVSITFMDGLPNDPKEEAEILASRTGNKATMSIKRALQVFDGMSPEDAEIELKQIEDEAAAADPMLQMGTPFNGNNDPNAGGGKGNE